MNSDEIVNLSICFCIIVHVWEFSHYINIQEISYCDKHV